MYNVVFVDECQDDVDLLRSRVEDRTAGRQIAIAHKEPLPTLDEMVEWIRESQPDALVADYLLNENKTDFNIDYNVPYNGMELVVRFLEIRPGFPCFVITAFENDATRSEACDVNLVYQKDLLHTNGAGREVSFGERIELQIGHYRKRISNAEARFYDLLEKQDTGLTAKEEEELCELDALLEHAIDRQGATPVRSGEFINKLRKFVENTDILLKELHDERE